jgi:hypothetical protein
LTVQPTWRQELQKAGKYKLVYYPTRAITKQQQFKENSHANGRQQKVWLQQSRQSRSSKRSKEDWQANEDEGQDKEVMAKTAAWQRKEGQNPKGGLNAKGRASAKAQGMNLKPPVSAKQAKKSPKAAARRKSFCARMGGMPGPMKDSKGRPTRKALALKKWDC